MKSPATLRDVARAAGVAIGTASRALNHHADVEPSLRQSVLKAAERLRYRPLREARAKPENATRKASGNIGLVLIGMADSLADLPVIASMIQGVERAAAARGNNLLLANVPVLDEVPRFVQEGSVDGLIVKSALAGTLPDVSKCALLQKLFRFPLVWLTDRPHGAVGDVSSYDVDAAAGLAVQHLKANGHRKVGFLNPRGGHALFSTLKRAFLREAAEHGMNASVYEAETRARWPLEAITTQDETGPLIDQWRVEKEALRPTALFVPADSIAVQAYAALRARGLRVGKDVSLASCNREVPLIQSLEPALTTIDIHAEALGSNAVELLASRIERRMREPQARIVVQPELVEGASVCNCLPEEQ